MVLKSREKIMIGAAVLIGVVMGFDQLLTQPKKKEAVALQKQVQEFNEKLASVTVSVSGLKQIQKRVEEKRKEKEALTGKIPDDRQLGMVLDRLGKETQTKKIELIQMNFSEPAVGGPKEGGGGSRHGLFRKVILEVDLASDFGAIGLCLENLSSLPIFLEIEKVDVRRKEEMFPKLLVTIQQTLHISATPAKQGTGP
jgi:hypothetical protein